MKAITYDQPGEPSVLQYLDLPDPVVNSDEVLVAVQAVSVEGGDLINRRSLTPPRPMWTLGYAAAGIVKAVGSHVKDRKVGDRVSAFNMEGSHAELWAVPTTRTWLVPDGVDLKEAAVVPISFGTAHYCLFGRGCLLPGETVLIQAAAGGVGIAAVQLAALAGAHVIAVASGSERCMKLKALGASHAIDRTSGDVLSEVMRLTGNKGVDVALDPVGTTLPLSLAALALEGRLVFVGNAGGGRLDVDLWTAMQSNQSLLGVFMGTLFERPPVRSMVDGLFNRLAAKHISSVIDKTFPLSRAAAAHAYAEKAKPFGRIVLEP